ncbi:MAG: ABC transporter permease [Treponema sp.]|jgi:simple sugar transport system permease protein|nr:ABC transporter permease [Treponema sp.]
MIFPVLHSAVGIMTPLLLTAMGGLFTEMSGMLNIALEGLLLTGAFAAVAAAHYSGSLMAGAAAAILASLILAAVLAWVTLNLKSNVFITGLAVNLFASGLTVVLSQRLFLTRGVVAPEHMPRLSRFSVPLIGDIPVIGDILSGHSYMVYLSWILLILIWLALYKTPFGFRLRACAKHSPALVSLGLKPDAYRFTAFLVSGVTCGIGGAFLSLNLGVFVPHMSSGKGWTALVVIFLGGRKPLGLLLAAFLFGLIEAFSNYAQGILNIPADFILAFPYIFTLLVMVGVSVYTKRKTQVS